MNVKDRVALVAGAVNDVGEAVGFRLSKSGARVVLADSNQEGLVLLEKKMSEAGGQVKGFAVDLTSSSHVEAAVRSIIEEFGTIDILVNCMDLKRNKPVSEISIDDWRSSIDTNLTPVFLFSKSVIPEMKKRKYGRIVNINDSDYLGMPGKADYSAVKSGVFGLTRSLALELARDGITVNSVVKGEIRESGVTLTEEELAQAAGRMPVKRLGTPDDVAYAACFMASDSSKYITGQTLFVCGGKSLYSSMSV
ncbi:MAG: SDR family oxidoreductase [Deltaproteobacteria bacterium]|nr:SDR family oxidoreductase [Deltaproteobacteria bacterium]